MTNNSRLSTRTLTGTAVLLALGVMLPIAFHALPFGGRIFLPMHIPALLAGLLLGPAAGLIVGAGSPLLSLLFTGRPPVPLMVPMLFELAAYGLVAGFARAWLESPLALRGRRSAEARLAEAGPRSWSAASCAAPRGRSVPALILALLIAMLAGRAVWVGAVVWLAPLLGIGARTTTAALAALGAGWVGMAVQLGLIPAIVRAIERPRGA